MTTYTDFAPSATEVPPFQFAPTLDGEVYNATATWNVFGQRWYLNIYSSSGDLILATPIVGSPQNYDISLVAGYFTSTLIYRQANNQFKVTP